jgi:hypothetical protein
MTRCKSKQKRRSIKLKHQRKERQKKIRAKLLKGRKNKK